MITTRDQQVTVDRLDLITILKSNREKHAEDYNLALKEWQTALIAETAALAKKTASGDFTDIKIESRKPEKYLENYDDIIEMLEMSVEPNITLDRSAFKSYVKDEWHFKAGLEALKMLNSSVTSKYLG